RVYFKNDRRVVAYLICVAIATGFWFLNALNKTYTVKMTVPVSYINLPNNKTLENQLPDKFDLTISSHGFNILRHQVSFLFMPFEFNVKEMTDNRMMESKKNSFAFPSRQFLTELSNQFSNEMEILSMSPDTLFFKFGKMGHKLMKVKPMVMVNLKKQYQISGGIETNPDSVMVNGPQSVLDTMHFVRTELEKFNSVDEPIQAEASLSKIKEVFFDVQKVGLNIPVEEYTEAQLSVPVVVKDPSSAGVNIKLFPEKVKVTFKVGLSRFEEIRPEDFKLTVAYSDIGEGKQRLKVITESIPAYLYDLKIAPEEIEYLIQN
ncbi:MAG TPA: hypothetical protein VGK10_19970, partial [Prolixibacteraceae bacterium]